jgi:hypothetical protein
MKAPRECKRFHSVPERALHLLWRAAEYAIKTMYCEMPAGNARIVLNDDSIDQSIRRLRAVAIAVPAGQMLLDSGFPKNDNTSL